MSHLSLSSGQYRYWAKTMRAQTSISAPLWNCLPLMSHTPKHSMTRGHWVHWQAGKGAVTHLSPAGLGCGFAEGGGEKITISLATNNTIIRTFPPYWRRGGDRMRPLTFTILVSMDKPKSFTYGSSLKLARATWSKTTTTTSRGC